jgi:uncharacterized protein YdaU (DUF1376 family)
MRSQDTDKIGEILEHKEPPENRPKNCKMAKHPALMLWTDAYLSDTRHLTTAQHGAYLLLLMTMWRSETCSVPDNDDYLALVTGMDVRTWKKNRPVIETFLQRSEGNALSQKRLLIERKYADEIAAKRAAAGRESARIRGAITPTHVEHMPNGCSTNVEHTNQQSSNIARLSQSKPIQEEENPARARTREKPTRKLAADVDSVPLPLFLDTQEFRTELRHWVDHKKLKRDELTQYALSLLINRCEGWGLEKSTRLIRNAIERGWKGVFDPGESTETKQKAKSVL